MIHRNRVPGRGRHNALRVLALILGAAGAIHATSLASSGPPWRVLILYGSDPFLPATLAQTQALRSALSEGAAPRPVTFRTEVLDAIGFGSKHHENELLALLRKKHRDERFDVVMPMGEASLAFAQRHREELWPGAPLVYFSTSPEALPPEAHGPRTTGVALAWDEVGTLDLARRLQPGAQRLVLVAGASEYDRYLWPRLEALARDHGQGLEVETLFGQPLPTILDRVSRLPSRSIVFYTTITHDEAGQLVEPAMVADEISRASTAPVYSIYDSYLGWGVLGVSAEGFPEHGRRAAAVALRVLHGASPDGIPVAPPPRFVAMVDWRQLRRFGLSADRLPPGAVILHRPPSFIDEYRGYVISAAAALLVQAGLIVALLAQARRRRRAEAESAHQRAELAHAARLSAVGELTAAISHEINQPLGAILSNAEAAELFLDSSPPRLDRVRRILRDIQLEDQRASAVIREVRALARKQPLQPQPVDLNQVVTDMMTLVAADARRRAAEVETALEPRLPLVSGDRTQLQQVLLNLALNGLDAMKGVASGVRILRIRTRTAGEGVELSVIDTGPGLAAEDIPRLFDSFFSTKADGLGLGLSLVRSIVEAHGGRVGAENNSGPGATFRVFLPLPTSGPEPPERV